MLGKHSKSQPHSQHKQAFFFFNCEAELEFSGDAAGTVGTARWENNPA